ncbi:CocE/NonD family hydrolase [Kitasatospora sp. NPDC002040]|uniref:CocE/NonD family hydrolase n=1 Tax=Kitasatospora sp. NPDC002040 TaxID=3154661 RepID=UPI00331CCAAF
MTSRQRPPRTARLLRRTLRGLPPRRYEVGHRPGLTVPAADGSPLLTDRYFPLGPGRFPTVLLRSPYGRGFPWAPMYGLALAEQGFNVVLQSCRGTAGSGGESALWRHERADGLATLEWLRGQPWFTGVLGTVGPSYLGYAQWALAAERPPELRAMVLLNAIHDPHAFFWSGGVFNLENALVATVGLEHFQRGVGALLGASLRLRRNLRRATTGLPLREAYTAGTGGRVPYLEEAMDRPAADDPFWAGADLGPGTEHSTVPTALITGWSDVCLGQTLRQWERLRGSATPASLLVGPWTHTSALGPGWADVHRETLAWLRAHLTDDPSGLRPTPVRVHTDGQWQDLPDWPAAGPTRHWYLADGALTVEHPAAAGPVTFRCDPSDPTPSTGGALLSDQAGPRRNNRREAHPDVLTFDGEPLTAPLRLLGAPRLDLTVDSDHADLFVRLCDVDPRGRSVNIADGIRRLSPTGIDPATVTLELDPTAHTFAIGHRLRVQLSGAPHPRYALNPGTGEPFPTATRLEPARITVHQPAVLGTRDSGRTP